MYVTLLKSGLTLVFLSFSPFMTSLSHAADLNSPSLDSTISVQLQSLPCNVGGVSRFTSCVGSRQVGAEATTSSANQILNSGVFDGITNWTFDVNLDPNQSGPNTLGLSQTGLGAITGTLNFTGINLSEKALAIVLRANNAFSIYYIPAGTLQSATDLSWNTLGVSTDELGNPQGLSQVSVYFSDRPEAALTSPPLIGILGAGLAALPALFGNGSGSGGGGSNPSSGVAGITTTAFENESGFSENESDPSGEESAPTTPPDSTTPVPTPALLPGIIGMGVAAFRRRKTEMLKTKSESFE